MFVVSAKLSDNATTFYFSGVEFNYDFERAKRFESVSEAQAFVNEMNAAKAKAQSEMSVRGVKVTPRERAMITRVAPKLVLSVTMG